MYTHHDPDEWEVVSGYEPCTGCDGDWSRCHGQCNASASWTMRRKPPAELARIRAEKRRAEEDRILAQAEQIKARRALETPPPPLPARGRS